jgi:hypothetical protein
MSVHGPPRIVGAVRSVSTLVTGLEFSSADMLGEVRTTYSHRTILVNQRGPQFVRAPGFRFAGLPNPLVHSKSDSRFHSRRKAEL